MKKAIRVYITGTVQGVFFRKFIKDSADSLGLFGYVRNTEDGRVEAWIEGDGEKIEEMIAACNKGPPHASIRRVDILEEKMQDFKEFKILEI